MRRPSCCNFWLACVARIEGASGWQQFRSVTLAFLQPVILVVLVLRTIWVFNFELIYLLTGGGPNGATLTPRAGLQDGLAAILAWQSGDDLRAHGAGAGPRRGGVCPRPRLSAAGGPWLAGFGRRGHAAARLGTTGSRGLWRMLAIGVAATWLAVLLLSALSPVSVTGGDPTLATGLGRAHNGRVAQIPEPPLSRFLFADTRLAWFWLLVRLYTGWQWLDAGLGKIGNPAWFGPGAGSALTGFINGAISKSTGDQPTVDTTYASFLQAFVLPHAGFWSTAVVLGEIAIGLGLILGCLTGVAAFFGGLLNVNYLFAGTLSTNPLLFVLATWIVLAWRVAGWWGIDRWLLPLLGTPTANLAACCGGAIPRPNRAPTRTPRAERPTQDRLAAADGRR